MKEWIVKHHMAAFLIAAALIHAGAFAYLRFTVTAAGAEAKTDYDILKLVDIEEYVAPAPVEEPRPPEDVEVTTVYNQPAASETVIETEKPVVETNDPAYAVVEAPPQKSEEPVYFPQHKISQVPDIPTKEILARIEYPPIALRQGIEGIVYLELFIDQAGKIRRVSVLKDPGYGFADAAIAAITGMTCKPAMANGEPVAVRFRYPVRFVLN